MFATLATITSTDLWDVSLSDTVTDAAGNNCVSGIISPTASNAEAGPIDLDPANNYVDDRDIVISQVGKGLVFYVKYGVDGTIEWVNRAERTGSSGSFTDHALKMVAAPSGGVYFTGIAGNGNMQIASTILTDAGPGADRFAGKFNADGSLAWAKTFTSGAAVQYPAPGDIVVDEARGRLFVTGSQMNSNPGNQDGVVFALNIANPANVQLAWMRALTGITSSHAHDAVVDSSGNVNVLVGISGSEDFDPGAGKVTLSSGTGTKSTPSVLWELTGAQGNYVSALQFQPAKNSRYFMSDIAIDSSDNLYIAGYFTGTVDFQIGKNVNNLTSAGSNDVFVVKLSPSNSVLFATRSGGADNEQQPVLALGATGVYVASRTYNGAGAITKTTVVKLNATTGSIDTGFTYVLAGTVWPTAIAVSPTGRLRVVGLFNSIDTDDDGIPDLFGVDAYNSFWLDLE